MFGGNFPSIFVKLRNFYIVGKMCSKRKREKVNKKAKLSRFTFFFMRWWSFHGENLNFLLDAKRTHNVKVSESLATLYFFSKLQFLLRLISKWINNNSNWRKNYTKTSFFELCALLVVRKLLNLNISSFFTQLELHSHLVCCLSWANFKKLWNFHSNNLQRCNSIWHQ